MDSSAGLGAIGHRVVHGGGEFTGPVLIDAQVITRLEAVSNLAPLHNLANLAGIRVARELRPGLPQVAVFDTAFHHNLRRATLKRGSKGSSRNQQPEKCHDNASQPVRRPGHTD